MSINYGTCSWNYDSWVGLVYPKQENTAAAYLKHYAGKFRTVEIDSWFYRLPDPGTVKSYLDQVDSDFRFTCKVTNSITLTHQRGMPDQPNHDFLSPQLFEVFLQSLGPMVPRMDAIMFEFEYLNKSKMKDLRTFLDQLEKFFKQIPQGLPIGIEIRNKNYLSDEYFDLLRAFDVQHVFSEKEYMPPVYQVYQRFKEKFIDRTVVRLLGGNRKEIETITNGKWNQIVLPKQDMGNVVGMLKDMESRGMRIILNVNNHYEGSAPMTIDRIRRGF